MKLLPAQYQLRLILLPSKRNTLKSSFPRVRVGTLLRLKIILGKTKRSVSNGPIWLAFRSSGSKLGAIYASSVCYRR